MFRHRYVCRLANELSPIERDLELRRYYREHVIHPGGIFRATQLLYVDESSKKLKDCRRTRAWRVKGDKVGIPVVHTNAGNAGCVIASLSLEGVQSVSVVDINEEGNVDGERFLQAFREDILVTCEPYPGNRSVVIMDNAQVHMKLMVIAACTEVGVLVIFLPAYSFDYNPIELVFNVGKTKLRNRYGHGFLPPDVRIGHLFRECLYDCITPDIACNMYVKCYVPVTPEERAWANR
jgi:DDE superfamily endonuclease